MALDGKLSTIRFGLACGATCFLGMLFLGVLAAYFGYGLPMVQVIGSVYWGFEPTLPGSVIGAAWGMADGFVTGWLFTWFYNKL
jgi:hypothetical protein